MSEVYTATATFDKTTPEKVWESAGQPYWLSANGGTIAGNLTITGSEFVNGNVTVTGNESVTGILTVNNVLATSTTTGSLIVSGQTTLATVTSGAINQGAVGFPSYGLGVSLAGTQLNPLPVNATSTSSFAMACTDVVYATPGFVTFVVNNNYAFFEGQSISVSGTTNWNGIYQVLSVGTGTIRCTTTNTFPSEPSISGLIVPYYSAGVYEVSAICRVTQSVAPTPGSATEGISFGLDIDTSAPANYTLTDVQHTTNPLYTITGSYGQASFSIVGTVRVTSPLSRLWIITNTGAQTGVYAVLFKQITVKPIGVFRN